MRISNMEFRMTKLTTGFFIALSLLFVSCEITTNIDADHDPVLQVDAVFFTGEPMPVIEIKRSFKPMGSSKYEIDRESIMVTGADIELTHNGEPVTVEEESTGRYRPVSNEQVQAGDTFEITVEKDGKLVSAVACVPDYSVEKIELNPASEVELRAWNLVEAGLIREVWEGGLPVNIYLPFLPDYTAIQLLSEMEADLYGVEEPGPGGPSALEFYTYSKKEYSGSTTLSADQIVSVFYPREEGDEKPTGNRTVTVYSTIVIPEPIYETWQNTHSETLVPVTITNVEEGVGLFIGAMRIKKEVVIDVVLR